MRVAIDTTPLQTGHSKRGVGYYTKRLLESLEQVDHNNEYIIFSQGQKLPKVNLVHYPYFDLFSPSLPLVKKIPTIVTIYDVIPLLFPKHYESGLKGNIKFKFNKLLLRKNVDRVITISNCSKKDIQKYLQIKPEFIDVTYLAADPIFKVIKDKQKLEEIRLNYKLPPKFILYVGDVNYNKNLPGLYRAMANIQVPLVLVGESAKNDYLQEVSKLNQLAQKLNLEDKIIRTGYVPDEELVFLYNLAICYVQPSFYEGFGLPVLEAMACGCPVVCSGTSSLPEIGGDVPLYFNPKKPDEIVQKVNWVISLFNKNRQEYDHMAIDSIHQSRKFDWHKTAKETIKVYKKAIS